MKPRCHHDRLVKGDAVGAKPVGGRFAERVVVGAPDSVADLLDVRIVKESEHDRRPVGMIKKTQGSYCGTAQLPISRAGPLQGMIQKNLVYGSGNVYVSIG